MNLLPKNERFFDLFRAHLRLLCQSSALLRAGLDSGYNGVCEVFKQIEAHEHSGDEIIHQIFRELQSTFITPFDPEDIQTLATAIDNVLDGIEDVTFRITAYCLDPIPDPARHLGRLIDDSCQALSRAFHALNDRRPVLDDCIEVNRLESEADAIERTFLARLFRSNPDPLTLIKEKEIVDLLESTTDLCEDVADVLQNVSVKNS